MKNWNKEWKRVEKKNQSYWTEKQNLKKKMHTHINIVDDENIKNKIPTHINIVDEKTLKKMQNHINIVGSNDRIFL